MRKQLLYFGLSGLFFIFGYRYPELAALLAFAWVPALLLVNGDVPLWQKLSIGAWALLSASLSSAPQWALANLIAWILFVLGKSLWGRQRALLAFIFLILSAEALPFYTAWPKNLTLFLAEDFYQNPFWHPWLAQVGFLGASFQLLFISLLSNFVILKFQSQKKWSWLLLSTIAILLLIPVFLGLSADGTPIVLSPTDENFELLAIDRFIARLSLFLAFFLLLFALVRKLLPKENADDRFT